ncbi:hypothetical protein Tco_1089880 [Tanacetum coccineum]|uniref:FRIGIDA-like protein n=1 Tax=Tanacetum coccineum TaxID=301880 RepID=A0ABQ5I485_9ASTR
MKKIENKEKEEKKKKEEKKEKKRNMSYMKDHANEGSLMYLPPQQFTLVYAAPIHHQQHHTPVNPQQHSVSYQPFISPSATQQSQAEFLQLDSSLVVPTFQQGEDPIECINKAMVFLSVVASWFPPSNNQIKTSSNPINQATIQDGRVIEAGQILNEEQLVFLADPGISEASVALQTIPQNSAFQTEDLDAYDSDCDDLSSPKAVLMENLSSCNLEVLFKVSYSDSYLNDMINQDVQEMQYSEQTHIDDFQDNEIHSDSNTIPYSQYLQESQDAVIQDTNSSAPNDLLVLSLVEQMTDHVAHLDKENKTNKMINESLTTDLKRYKERVTIFKQRLNVDLNKQEKLIDSQMDDLIRDRNAKLAEESRSKMLDKQNDPISIEKKIKISLIDYSKLNKIKEDFGKCFVTKKELSAEQAFWLKHYSFSETPVTSHTPVRIEAPSKLPKDTFNAFDKTLLDEITEVQTVFNLMEAAADQCSSCVNDCRKYLELETELLENKDFIEKEAYDKLVKAQSQEKDSVIRKLKDIIKSLMEKEGVENVKKDINEIETINIELEHSVAKLLLENENLRKEREHLQSIYKDQFDSIRKTHVQSKEHCDSLIAQINAKSVKNSDLNAQLQEKVFAIKALKYELRKLKGKNVVNTAVSKPNATIAPGMFKLDIEPISLRLKNDRDAHKVYIEKIIEYTDTLWGFVECARTQYPSEPLIESACMFTKHVQELLVYASQTCPNSPKPNEKLVDVTPMNKYKRLRFADLITSSSNVPKQTNSFKS